MGDGNGDGTTDAPLDAPSHRPIHGLIPIPPGHDASRRARTQRESERPSCDVCAVWTDCLPERAAKMRAGFHNCVDMTVLLPPGPPRACVL